MKKAAEKELMVSASVSCMDLCHLADAIEIVSYYRKHS